MVLYYISLAMYIECVAPRVSASGGVWQIGIRAKVIVNAGFSKIKIATITKIKFSLNTEHYTGWLAWALDRYS